MTGELILVNELDEQTGTGEKLQVHREGLLHRAFSIFVFDREGRFLLQRRSESKYHSGGLWTNTCCSHPTVGESVDNAAKRRLEEEMGFGTKLVKVFDIVYRAGFANGLTEHEFDHVFVGEYDGEVAYNPEEVMDYCYLPLDEIRKSVEARPESFTVWFRILLPRIEEWWRDHYKMN